MTQDEAANESPASAKKDAGDGNTTNAFLRAARSGHLEKVLEFLRGNFDINTCNANGLNALHLSAKEGCVSVVQELLKRGAVVDAATKKGNTALHIASLAGQLEVVQLLIQHGANVNAQSQNGFTPLYMAAQENHLDIVKFLLTSGANQSIATDDGFTPLAVALQQGHEAVVQVLLDNDTRGKIRLPALHIAAKKDDVKAAALLLQGSFSSSTATATDTDAPPLSSDGDTSDATVSATVAKKHDMVNLVNETTRSFFTPLHIASHYGNANVAKLLIEHGADVNFNARNNITPLHVAAKWGRLNMVKLLVESNALVDCRTKDGLTPLHCAARSGHATVVEFLISQGCQVDAKTKNGLTALHMAAQGDQVDSAKLLLNKGVQPDDTTIDSLTALHVAAHCGNVRTAKLLLDRKCNVNARAMNGFTALHIACKKNRIKVVELLLKFTAAIDAPTESGLTALHVAAFMGHRNVVLCLLQNGASPNATNTRGETALHIAVRAGQIECVRMLLRHGSDVDARAREQQTALHVASRLGNADMCVVLLQQGAHPDAQTNEKYTALHIAAKYGHDEVAAALLEHGAKTELATRKHFTPLHLCAKYGRANVARLLVARRCNVEAAGKNGLTALHVAAHYRQPTMTSLLLDARASPHAAAKNGYTPLHIAAKKNEADIAQQLLDHAAKPNADSKSGFTPLHLACQEANAQLAALLARAGANVNARAKNGLSAMHLCAQTDCVAAAVTLASAGAELDAQTKAGFTPLHTACHFGSINMIRFLLERVTQVDVQTSVGYTPLAIAAQRGHLEIAAALLERGADVNVLTSTEQSALSIAESFGHANVAELLRAVTTVQAARLDEQLLQISPEIMQEQPLTDSEDDGADESLGGVERESTLQLSPGEMEYIRDAAASLGGDMLDATHMGSAAADENDVGEQVEVAKKVQAVHAEVLRSSESSAAHIGMYDEAVKLVSLSESSTHAAPESTGPAAASQQKGFLVSFVVDARGGVLWGTRFPGLRVIIPPRAASQPTRITCRLLRKDRLAASPPLNAAEGLAFRVIEMGPTNLKFSRPIAIEIPHLASLTDKWREVIVLRSENGETWKEHSFSLSTGSGSSSSETNDKTVVRDMLLEVVDRLDSDSELRERNVFRIVTTDFPMYFALITRVRIQVEQIGAEGGLLSSVVVPSVQSVYPDGALQKRIRIGLQTHPLTDELVQRVSGGTRVCCSPIVTIEPRRRKFHKPITLAIPISKPISQSMLNQSPVEAQTLRLLCSITGGTAPVQWEDITGSTQLTVVKNSITFTTTVSARFWLIDTPTPGEVVDLATRLYREACVVPYLGRFVVYAKRVASDPVEAKMRVLCVTDDKPEKTLELQEGFSEVARSGPVDVLDCRPHFFDVRGNLLTIDAAKPGESQFLNVLAFRENRLPLTILLRDANAPARGQLAFFRQPFENASEKKLEPFCQVNVEIPTNVVQSRSSASSRHDATHSKALAHYDSQQHRVLTFDEELYKAKMKLSDVAKHIGEDWMKLGEELGIPEGDLQNCLAQSSDPERALEMLLIWTQTRGIKATGNELAAALRRIGRQDVLAACAHDEQPVRDARERQLAQQQADKMNGGSHDSDDLVVAAKSAHERAEERNKQNAELKAQIDSKQRAAAMQDIADLLDKAVLPIAESAISIEPKRSQEADVAGEQVERSDAKKLPKVTPAPAPAPEPESESEPAPALEPAPAPAPVVEPPKQEEIDLSAFALPTVPQSLKQEAPRKLEDDESEAPLKHGRYGSAEEKRKANDAARQAISNEDKTQALSDLVALLGAQELTEDHLRPHTTSQQHREQPDLAEERVEAVRKEDVKAAAPKSGPKPHEAAPDEDVEEREVRSNANAAQASPSAFVPDEQSANVDRSEMDSTVAKASTTLPPPTQLQTVDSAQVQETETTNELQTGDPLDADIPEPSSAMVQQAEATALERAAFDRPSFQAAAVSQVDRLDSLHELASAPLDGTDSSFDQALAKVEEENSLVLAQVTRATFQAELSISRSQLDNAHELPPASSEASETVESAQPSVYSGESELERASLSPLPPQASGDPLQKTIPAEQTNQELVAVRISSTEAHVTAQVALIHEHRVEELLGRAAPAELTTAQSQEPPLIITAKTPAPKDDEDETTEVAVPAPAPAQHDAAEQQQEAPGRFQLLLASEQRERMAEKLDSPVQSPDDALKPFYQADVATLSKIDESEEAEKLRSSNSASASASASASLSETDSAMTVIASQTQDNQRLPEQEEQEAPEEPQLSVDSKSDSHVMLFSLEIVSAEEALAKRATDTDKAVTPTASFDANNLPVETDRSEMEQTEERHSEMHEQKPVEVERCEEPIEAAADQVALPPAAEESSPALSLNEQANAIVNHVLERAVESMLLDFEEQAGAEMRAIETPSRTPMAAPLFEPTNEVNATSSSSHSSEDPIAHSGSQPAADVPLSMTSSALITSTYSERSDQTDVDQLAAFEREAEKALVLRGESPPKGDDASASVPAPAPAPVPVPVPVPSEQVTEQMPAECELSDSAGPLSVTTLELQANEAQDDDASPVDLPPIPSNDAAEQPAAECEPEKNPADKSSPYEGADTFTIPPTLIEEEDEDADLDEDPDLAAQYAALQREYQLTADQTFGAVTMRNVDPQATTTPSHRLSNPSSGSRRAPDAVSACSISSSLAEFEKLETEISSTGSTHARDSSSNLSPQRLSESGSSEAESPDVRRKTDLQPLAEVPSGPTPREESDSATVAALPSSDTAASLVSGDSAEMAASTDSMSVSSSSHTTVMNQSVHSVLSLPNDSEMFDSGMRQSTDEFASANRLSTARDDENDPTDQTPSASAEPATQRWPM